MKIRNDELKTFISKYIVFLIILVIGTIVYWITEGSDAILNLFIVLVGILCPLFVIVYLLNFIFSKARQRKDVLIIVLNLVIALVFLLFIMTTKQRQMFLVLDGIIGLLIAIVYISKKIR